MVNGTPYKWKQLGSLQRGMTRIFREAPDTSASGIADMFSVPLIELTLETRPTARGEQVCVFERISL